jgi:hypothetical protein
MRKICCVALLFFSLGIFWQSSYACSCITVESPEKDPKKAKKAAKNFYRKKFKGALFTGKVLDVEVAKQKIDDEYYTLQKKITIQVEKYWLGVKESTMTIYTGIGGGDCGINFEKGKRYFFSPQYLEGVLRTGICDYLSADDMSADGKSVKGLNEILGEAKAFEAEDAQ